jgi:pentatricopeptide repeat protein
MTFFTGDCLLDWIPPASGAQEIALASSNQNRFEMQDEQAFSLKLFGIPAASRPQAGFAFPAKGYQLIALVLLSPSRRVTRQKAASLLWENAGEVEAFANLRQLLVRIRRAWPPGRPLIESEGALLSAGPGAEDSDLAVFLKQHQSQAAADLVSAIRIFDGELLAGAGDANGEFHLWLLGERAKIKDRFFSTVATAMLELTRYGRAREADLRMVAERALAAEPEREQTYRTLIEAYGRNGMFEEAKRLYTNLTELLKREFSVSPSPETAAVARRIFASARDHAETAPSPERSPRTQPRVAFLPPELPAIESHPELIPALVREVANELSRYRTFKVIAPHSSFQIVKPRSGPDFGQIDAQYALSSMLIPHSDVLSCRLARTDSGEIIWAGEFPADDRKLAVAFRLLSYQTAASLAHAIERDRLDDNRRQHDGAAYLRYLEGQISLQNCDLPRLRRARSSFRDAAATDPDFSATRAKIAQTFHLEWLMLGGNDPDLLLKARAEANAAVALDPGAGAGHWMDGVVALYQRDYDGSAESFAVAETLTPHAPDFLVQYADALSHLGDTKAGWERFERAIELNPLAPDHYWWAGASILLHKRDFHGAIEMCGRMKSDEPVIRLLAAAHALAGDIRTAETYGKRIKENYPGSDAKALASIPPYKLDADRHLLVEGFRLAGIK